MKCEICGHWTALNYKDTNKCYNCYCVGETIKYDEVIKHLKNIVTNNPILKRTIELLEVDR